MGAWSHRTPARALPRLPALDGLRALAVVAVFLYHLPGAPLAAGFFGVDLFFVISGYLITAGLLSEAREHGRIRFGAFYLRRIRRLVPAIVLLLLMVFTVAVLWLPRDIVSLRGVGLSAFAGVTNWYLIFGDVPYFEAMGRESLLQHLWSLAIEAQFYLVWPLLIAFVFRRVSQLVALIMIALLAIGSTVWMWSLFQAGADPSRLYYGTDTHATPFLVGALLAFALTRRAWGRVTSELVGAFALAVFVMLTIQLNQTESLVFSGGFLLAALAGAALIAASEHDGTYLHRVLRWRPIRWLGERSYGVYLWHWPVLLLLPGLGAFEARNVPQPELVRALIAAAVTLVIAAASYRFVERPILRGIVGSLIAGLRGLPGHPTLRGDATFGIGASAFALVAALVIAVGIADRPAPPEYLPMAALTTTPAVRITPRAETTPSPISPASSIFIPAPLPEVNESGTPFVEVSATPTPRPVPVTTPIADLHAGKVTAVGDSVMLGAADALTRAIEDVSIDAAPGRSAMEAMRIIQARLASGTLGEVVVVGIGNNGVLTGPQLDQLMSALTSVKQVLIVNVRVPRPWEEPNNALFARLARDYSNVRVIDWNKASTERPDALYNDNVHLTPEGAAFYAGLIAAQLR